MGFLRHQKLITFYFIIEFAVHVLARNLRSVSEVYLVGFTCLICIMLYDFDCSLDSHLLVDRLN